MCKSMISLSIVLSLVITCTGYADVVIGDWEKPDSYDGWSAGEEDANAVLKPGSTVGVTSGSGSLDLKPSVQGYWVLEWQGEPMDLNDMTLQFDLTMIASEWTESNWTKVADKIAISSNGPSDWKEYDNLTTAVDSNSGELAGLDWAPGQGDITKTCSLDISDYDSTGAAWMKISISIQQNPVSETGHFYFDNVRIKPKSK